MMLNIAAILIVLASGYIWLTRGFFSALIHLLCTIIAGAVTFAFFETIAYGMLESVDGTGIVGGMPWALAIGGTFSIVLIVLRIVIDQLLPANIVVHPGVDYAGGAVCGAFAGVLSAGIFLMSVSTLRLGSETFQSVTYNVAGSPVHSGASWIPFDSMTLKFYSLLSERGLRTGEPLARYHPDLVDLGSTLNMNPFDGTGRNTIKPSEFSVTAAFTVGKGANLPITDLVKDQWDPSPQTVVMPDDTTPPAGSYIAGYVVSFNPGSKERDGRTAIGAAQVRLLLESEDGNDRMTVFAFAASSEGDPVGAPGTYRWRFNSPSVFIASVGASAESVFAFEFMVPPGYKPLALYVKGCRVDVTSGPASQPKFVFASATERDAEIAQGLGFGKAATVVGPTGGVQNLVKPTAPISGFEVAPDVSVIAPLANQSAATTGYAPAGVSIGVGIGFVVQEGQHGGLEITSGRVVTGGFLETDLETKRIAQQGLERSIRIEQFMASADRCTVKVDMSGPSRSSLLGKVMNAAEAILPPTLVDTKGERYQPIGYIYEDETKVQISFNPGNPIRGMSQLPALSRSRPAQKLQLIFHVTYGREIKYLSMGNKVFVEYNPPFKLDQIEANR